MLFFLGGVANVYIMLILVATVAGKGEHPNM